jgi:HEAT repeat protein
VSAIPLAEEIASQIQRLGFVTALECRQIADSLRQLGPTAVEPLMAALQHENPNVRWWAAWTLGEIGEKRAVSALVAALEDPDWGVRRTAVAALGKIGDPQAVEPLVARLGDRAIGVRWEARKALESWVSRAVERGDVQALSWLRLLDRWSLNWRHPGLREAVQRAIADLEAQVAHIPDTALSPAELPAVPSPSQASLSRTSPPQAKG